MTNIASHIRIYDPNPTDELVIKRTAAVKEINSLYSKSQPVVATYKLCSDLAQALESEGEMHDEFASTIEAAIQKSSKAFIAEGNHLEMKVCALLGALQAVSITRGSSAKLQTPDVTAICLWSALSFQRPLSEPKLEILRTEVLEKAREFTLKIATATRVRFKVPDIEVEETDETDTADAATLFNNFKEAADETIAALRDNSAVDREEIDLLWWVLSDWSDLLQRRYSHPDKVVANSIAAGLEAGALLRRLPSDAHRHLVLRHVPDVEAIDMNELLTALGTEAHQLASSFAGNTIVTRNPAIFPLLSALVQGESNQPSGQIKRSLKDWAARALLERSTLHITSHLPNVGV